MAECTVLPGITGLLIQGVLFLTCVGILILKKVREDCDADENGEEEKKRSWKDFGRDSSKQILGAGWIHVMNLFFAKTLEAATDTGSKHDQHDQCEWYWINIMIDTTLGVAVEWALLWASMQLIRNTCEGQAEDLKTGAYKGEDGKFHIEKYLKQLILWLLVVTGMKACMVFLMFNCRVPLQAVASFVLHPVIGNPTMKLLCVMIVTPVCMNAFQFWVVDNIIKKHPDEDEDDEDTDKPE